MKIQCWRGQYGEHDGLFKRHASWSFTAELFVAMQYATEPNDLWVMPIKPTLYRCELTLNKLLMNNDGDCYMYVNDLLALGFPQSLLDRWGPEYRCSVGDSIQVWRMLDDFEFITAATVLGFDGAIYQGSGCGGGTAEIRCWGTADIKVLSVTTV